MLLALAALASAQSLDEATLVRLQHDHLDLQQRGMWVLGAWAGANISAGGVGWALSDRPRPRSFWQGNAAWNLVNLGIAGASLATLPARRRAAPSEENVRQQVRGFERALAINAGLDVLYIIGGLALRHHGTRRRLPRLQGFGDALIGQGGFLLAFDLTLLGASRGTTRELR